MSRSIRNAGILAAVIAIISIGAFFYLTREIAAPSENVQASVEQLETSSDSATQTVYRISQDASKAEYNIFEVLNGADKTVVGTTSQVAGDILVNLSDPSKSEIGDIAINARTFATDDGRRDNSVARFILQSESSANEFITFKTTSVSGLTTTAVNVGDSLTFQITGDLTIAGTTKPATFTVSATLESADKLVGQAQATILRSDFNLSVPNVPFVANVGDEVTLKLNFVANAVK
ncbi:MAG: YceI family protein [Anaerolineae bacterium]|nr:YceI family protein [Anaerolineae bacterium]